MIYTGFFDAAFDEESGTYDREYDSADFIGYFEQIVGSGVCVYSNDDSMKVYYDSASQRAVVNPGYLFIRGYWLKNDGLYTVSLEGLSEGTYAIRAVLSMSARAISIGQVEKADPEEYPDSLVLAYATIDANNVVTVEDTRGRTDICGLIDAAGSLSQKVEYAINYINNEIDAKLDQIKEDLQTQEVIIDGKIEEANGLIAKIAPPAVGTIKFSASQDVGEEWLRCDGRFVNEVDYPELVAALGKYYPSGDKFQLLNTDGVGTQISNGVICEGKLWVFSYADRKLYGIDIEGDEGVKTIELSSDDPNFANWQSPDSNFLALSIIPNLTTKTGYRIFLVQINQPGNGSAWDSAQNLLYTSDFLPESEALELSNPKAFDGEVTFTGNSAYKSAIPYVVSKVQSETEVFYMAAYMTQTSASKGESSVCYFTWNEEGVAAATSVSCGDTYHSATKNYISGFSLNNFGELVFPVVRSEYEYQRSDSYEALASYPENTFNREESELKYANSSSLEPNPAAYEVVTIPVVAGAKKAILGLSPDLSTVLTIDRTDLVGEERVEINVQFPSASKIFMSGNAYLWGKDIFMLFVGTGILFSREMTVGSFGFLDTTSVLGTITQYASLQYSQDEGTLYIVGQDTTNRIKAAKIMLNTLFDYANDGAWLPMIASDGIPAYIKAVGEIVPPTPDPVIFENLDISATTGTGMPALQSIFDVKVNGEPIKAGVNVEYPGGFVTFELVARQDYENQTGGEIEFNVLYKYYPNAGTSSGSQVLLGGAVKQKDTKIVKGETYAFQTDLASMKELYPSDYTSVLYKNHYVFVMKSSKVATS